MAKTRQILQVTQRLREGAQARDWEALARTSRDVAALLAPLAQDSLLPAERHALRELREVHQQAHDLCNSAAKDLQCVLAELRVHKDGWLAYAAHGDLNDSLP